MSFSLTDEWNVLASVAGGESPDTEGVCTTISRIMRVDRGGIGILKVRGLTLEFVYPFELRSAGRIPLSSPAVAARTATTKKSELFNNFAKTSHNSVFELVPLDGAAKNVGDPQHIQKLMSSPVIGSSGRVLGVVQVLRKGPNPDDAGPDFTEADLQTLEKVALHLETILAAL